MDYEQKYKEALEKAKGIINYYKEHNRGDEAAIEDLEIIFPELQESEDEKIKKVLVEYFQLYKKQEECGIKTFYGIPIDNIIAWLEKQEGQQKPIINVPSKELIFSIWDLGNEWKELTNGRISEKYGTQLNYIQKHWHESEYFLRGKQDEQKPTWSEEDEENLQHCCGAVFAADYYTYEDKQEMEQWLKSLKERLI